MEFESRRAASVNAPIKPLYEDNAKNAKKAKNKNHHGPSRALTTHTSKQNKKNKSPTDATQNTGNKYKNTHLQSPIAGALLLPKP